MEVSEATGIPLLEGWTSGIDLPHTITTAVTYRLRINSLMELSKDKRPPRDLWDKPFRLNEFLDEILNRGNKGNNTKTQSVDFDPEEVE